ncbi:MAG: UDP-N-acetylglucosamine 2-epimerase (non-hydrolyzing) [Pseudomonadales bacterium]|nr:UDP-N-acetylglucosamine 2-epimerase (non-hydrolyzing) [Pseudomonadales bacterium]
MKVALVVGTRPEAIKMSPLYLEMTKSSRIQPTLINTGQHNQMCTAALDAFDIGADFDLNLMRENQSLGSLTARLFEKLEETLVKEQPDWVIVQGDTTTAMVAAMSAFYLGIPVAHVEAGLRTFDLQAPFPEEANRVVISDIASLHLAPTETAASNLTASGVHEERVSVTGNTVVDAVRLLRPSISKLDLSLDLDADTVDAFSSSKTIFVTCHRRESFDQGIANVCTAVARAIKEIEGISIVFPVHLNPNVRSAVHSVLRPGRFVRLLEPISYLTMMWCLDRCYLVVSDSGGLQEECPSFNKPVLITRDVTERPEVISAGAGVLVGTDEDMIFEKLKLLLTDDTSYQRMATVQNPFGDGYASKRIVAALLDRQ